MGVPYTKFLGLFSRKVVREFASKAREKADRPVRSTRGHGPHAARFFPFADLQMMLHVASPTTGALSPR